MCYKNTGSRAPSAALPTQNVIDPEGLYQCIIYNKARNHPEVDSVEREYKIKLKDGKTGYLDFVFSIGDKKYAVELKAGANSYRSSLDKAKEVDKKYGSSKTGGILKDIEKLSIFLSIEDGVKRESILICLETAYIRNGFDDEDISHYSALTKSESICFVYGTAGYSGKAKWILKDEENTVYFKGDETHKKNSTSDLSIDDLDWVSYFDEINLTKPKDETFSQGNLYHYLRNMGLNEKQCASEVFFHFAKKPNSRASYWKPDLAVFNNEFNGRFNLGVDNNEKRQNDYEKLKSLAALIEIKGSKSFNKLGIERKTELISEDIDKLHQHLYQPFKSKLRSEGLSRTTPVQLIMVVADSDSNLEAFIRDTQKEYEDKVHILWSGDYHRTRNSTSV